MGTGPAGKAMKLKGHHIPVNAPTSLVTRAARSGEVVTVDNVREAPDWLPNPLLPATSSEMAVPILLEGQVVGVLDVQEDEIAGLDEGDASLLRSLANQVAVAIRNARLFNEVETALAKAQALQERYLEHSWEKAKIAQHRSQYLYVDPGAAPLDGATTQLMTETRRQVLANKQLEVVTVNSGNMPTQALIAPITLHDKTIGALQLHNSRENRSWTEDEMAVIEAVVDQLAQTAENLRLFGETRSRAARERITRQITDKMRAAPDVDSIIQTGLSELARALGVPRTYVKLTEYSKAKEGANGSTMDAPHYSQDGKERGRK